MKEKRISLKRPVGIVWFYLLLICLFAFNTYADEWDGWTIDNGVWEIGVPTAGSGGCHGDGDCAGTVLDGNYPCNPDSRFMSPQMELPVTLENEELLLRFRQFYNYQSGDRGEVQIQTYDEGAESWSGWKVLKTVNSYVTKWHHASIDITEYSGQRVRIGFYHTDNKDTSWDYYESTGWYIDNIQILKTTSTDIDGDTIPNEWEKDHWLDPDNPDDALMDSDNDGLSNAGEYANNTDPNNPDSDGDELPDGWEVRYGLDPNDDGSIDLNNGPDGDIDEDGIINIKEFEYGLNPTEKQQEQVDVIPGNSVVSIGGSNKYEVSVTNIKIVPESYTLSVDGLDPAWYGFSEDEFQLLAGEEKTVLLEIHIPEDCAIIAQDYLFTVNAVPASQVLPSSMDAVLTVLENPILTDITPEDGEIMVANQLFISWQTDSAGTSEVFYRKAGTQEFSTAVADPGTSHNVFIEDLDWNTSYVWYVKTETACGVSESSIRENKIAFGVVFVDAPYSFSVERDYEQIRMIQVKNTDNQPHEVLLTILNPADDLITGFRGDGSMDQTIVLQPVMTHAKKQHPWPIHSTWGRIRHLRRCGRQTAVSIPRTIQPCLQTGGRKT